MEGSLGLRFDPLTSSTATRLASLSSTLGYTADMVQADSYLDQNISSSQNGGQLGGELSSTLLWQPDAGFRATSQEVPADMALVAVALEGPPGQALDVTINSVSRASAHTGDTVVLAVPAYEKVKVGVQSSDNRTYLNTQEKQQTIFGYPGNVAYRTFHVRKSVVMMGTLTDAGGRPLTQARFTLRGEAYYTDETGFFTLETFIAPEEDIALEGADFTCPARLPAGADKSELADLGALSCMEKQKPGAGAGLSR